MQIIQTALAKDSITLEPFEPRHLDGVLASVRDPSFWKFMSFADLSDAALDSIVQEEWSGVKQALISRLENRFARKGESAPAPFTQSAK